mgnify:FL=1
MRPTSDGNGNHFVQYNELKLLTAKEAKALPREARSRRIRQEMKSVGFDSVNVSTIIDSVSDAVLSIFENQYELLSRYKTIVDNHKDVMSFIHANEGKSKKELKAEAERFDRLAERPEHKIGPKMKAYQKATDEIMVENIKLGGLLLYQTARLASVFMDNADEIRGAEALAMLLNAGKIDDAYKLAEIRLHLAKIANDFIADEKAVLEITKQIQDILDEKL